MKRKSKITKKKIIKGLRAFSCCCLILAAAGVLCLLAGNYYVRKSVEGNILETDENSEGLSVDCILVLGCGLRPDGEPTQMLQELRSISLVQLQSF